MHVCTMVYRYQSILLYTLYTEDWKQDSIIGQIWIMDCASWNTLYSHSTLYLCGRDKLISVLLASN